LGSYASRAGLFLCFLMTPLTEDEVRRRLDPARVIAAIENAFCDRFPSTVMPTRTHLNLQDGIFLAMPCYDRAGHSLGMKLVVVQEKPIRPEDGIQATYMLLDPATGHPRLLIPANYLTDLRTAATSAVATKALAQEDAKTLGVFGTGRQARAHIEVMPLARRFERVLVCGKDARQTREFAKKMSALVGSPVECVDAETCAAESDVICTCTTSQKPLFDGRRLRPGTHLNLVGAFQPQAREVDEITVQRSRVVVDTYDGALAEAGDLLIPMRHGLIARDHIAADLHELLSGKKPGRMTAADITLFKSVGCALEDLVTAELLVP
jgi:ornithine cyclodeaminase/alanine dehydrogenase-like protein (mu-crystallin family)